MTRHAHARLLRPLGGLGVLLASLSVSAGCTHNYYYGASPCAPGTTALPAGAVPYGSVCDVPTKVGGGVAVSEGSTVVSSPGLGGPRPPRVVLSEPNGGTRFPWRWADPDSGLVTTKVDGAVEDQSRTR